MAIPREKPCPECGVVTLNLSWSAIKTFASCPQQSFLQRSGHRLKLQDIRNMWPGTICDRVLRKYLDDPNLQFPGSMASMVIEVMDTELEKAKESGNGVVKWRNAMDRQEVTKFCQEVVTDLEPIMAEMVISKELYLADYKFKTPITIPFTDGTPTTVNLIGAMDIWIKNKDKYEVYDLKVTKNDNYWRETLGQMVFYDLATYSEFGQFTSRVALIQPACARKIIDFEVTKQMRMEMMQQIINMAHGVWLKEQTMRSTTDKCHYCNVKHACARGKAVNKRMVLPTIAILKPKAQTTAERIEELLAD